MDPGKQKQSESLRKSRVNIVLISFTFIAVFFLIAEHKAHILGFLTEHKLHILNFLPYLFLLLCPVLHIFMHGGHKNGHGGHGNPGHGNNPD